MTPSHYFQKAVTDNGIALTRLEKRLFLLSMSRLVVFLCTVLMLYFFWGNTAIIASCSLFGFAGFLFLVSKYSATKYQRNYHQKIKELNEAELRALHHNLSGFDTGEEFLQDSHHYNQDIDLFGSGSLFQLINRTGTLNGKAHLAALLNANDIHELAGKQQVVAELSESPDWRQHFQVTASMIGHEAKTESIIHWMHTYKAKLPKVFRVLPLLFSLCSITLFVLYGFGLLPGLYLAGTYLLGLAITTFYLKRVNKLYIDANTMKGTFAQYSKLIHAIEEKTFQAKLSLEAKALLLTHGTPASVVLSSLVKEIYYLAQRNNVFFSLLANGFFLWDLRYAYRVEKWITHHAHTIEQWFKAVTFFDAYNSLGNFAFVHTSYTYPTLDETADGVITAQHLGHPLLVPKQNVHNDITIADGNFFIITGANMAGKSTFLRTVALSIVMANCGLPVCATTFRYRPIKLISSMRTSDSLQDGESYFFSELKRLKFIVEKIKQDRYFIILDEILKGTNSKDKAEGSKQFVERLVKSNATGLIATHDLSLCELSKQLPQVQNYYFDAQVVEDELYFDYQFKKGICQNMNASFLLKKMEIV